MALAAAAGATARAQTAPPGGVIAAPAPPPARPPRPDAVPIDENTARMIGGGRLKLGILAFEYSPIDFFSFGTDPPAWALAAVGDVLVPNAHVKLNFVKTPALLVSGMGAAYYASISTGAAKGHLFVVPATLYVSVRPAPPLWLHLKGVYNWARGVGSGDVSRPDIDGAAIMRTAQVGAMAELRLSRVVALIARGRYQFYETPIVLEGSANLDAFTQASGSLEIRSSHEHPVMGLAGVALTWKYVGVTVGGGYGNYFLPGMNVSDPHVSFVPEGSLWAVF
jgi:hypothetical protein